MSSPSTLRRVARACLALLILAGAASAAIAEQVQPFDEAAKDPALVEFRAALMAKVKAKDAAGIVPMLTPDVTLTYGEALKPKDFPRHMQRNPNLWAELQRVLENGGGFAGSTDEFFAPYPFAFLTGCMEKDIPACKTPADAHSAAVLMAKDVVLRAAAADTAAAVATLSYEITGIIDQQRTKSGLWLKVQTRAGKQGYIPARLAFQEYGFRAVLKKTGAQWKLSAFVVGD